MSQAIMVVDDSAIIRMQLSTVLESNGYEAVQASTGIEALEVAKSRNDIRLVITDVNMPGMNGLTLLSELRGMSSYSEVPVFVLTTESTAHMQEQGRDRGASAWIVKPFHEESLLKGIEMMLNR